MVSSSEISELTIIIVVVMVASAFVSFCFVKVYRPSWGELLLIFDKSEIWNEIWKDKTAIVKINYRTTQFQIELNLIDNLLLSSPSSSTTSLSHIICIIISSWFDWKENAQIPTTNQYECVSVVCMSGNFWLNFFLISEMINCDKNVISQHTNRNHINYYCWFSTKWQPQILCQFLLFLIRAYPGP